MIKEKITIDEMIEFLNGLLEDDPEFMNSLFAIRVNCNKKLANHPTVQVASLGGDFYIAGIIGIFNGLFGINDKDGWGSIVINYDKHRIKNIVKRNPKIHKNEET